MPKILTDKELAEIVYNTVHDDSVLDCADSYTHFIEDLADLIERHFGGEAGSVEPPKQVNRWTVAFHLNDSVPSDGGIYKNYDENIIWSNGVET